MIEPTESEPMTEIERFCQAMIALRDEIRQLEENPELKDHPLHNAPHTAGEVTKDNWQHPYSRQHAAFPLAAMEQSKYWPPVGRIDAVYGDRNLETKLPD